MNSRFPGENYMHAFHFSCLFYVLLQISFELNIALIV